MQYEESFEVREKKADALWSVYKPDFEDKWVPPELLYNKHAEAFALVLDRPAYAKHRQTLDCLGDRDRGCPIVDVGCGDGLMGQVLADAGYTNMTGMDISGEMLKLAESRRVYKDLQKGDIAAGLQYEDQRFQVLVCLSVTAYLPPESMRELTRVVQKEGTLVISFSNKKLPKWMEVIQPMIDDGTLQLVRKVSFEGADKLRWLLQLSRLK
eukprot:NODE_1824_length_725_cov_88.715719_g1774_i0.p1 GENE.NODE_1824_length_725_cov_88.715719_g1774_i0~~NODE_1824_length_725_cov_88.715719_g1774_i0.p1  ORF type:complete len:211 (+),score=20.07 NODE_1824_length_725_cov_88.715719_g1774_i0:83-715(+)